MCPERTAAVGDLSESATSSQEDLQKSCGSRDQDDVKDGAPKAREMGAAGGHGWRFEGNNVTDAEGNITRTLLEGQPMYPDGRSKHSKQGPLGAALALLTMAVYLCWIHILLALAVAAFYSRTAALLLAGIWATVLLPAKPLLWRRFLRNPVMRLWRSYFNMCVVVDWQEFDLSRHYVYAEFPHGAFPLSPLISATLEHVAWPNHAVYSVAASSLFGIPLWRHIMSWIGACPASEANFRRLLQRGSVAVVPGGIAEMFKLEPDREVVLLSQRKGFVRMAVEAGAAIAPVYHFGNSRLFKWEPKSWEAASRRHRVSLGFLLGVWNLPLPHRVPLMVVVGKPVAVKRLARGHPGFEAAVDEAHAALVAAVQQLYETYRGLYHDGKESWAGRPLEIL